MESGSSWNQVARGSAAAPPPRGSVPRPRSQCKHARARRKQIENAPVGALAERLVNDGYGVRHFDRFAREPASSRDRLDAGGTRRVEGAPVGRVDVARKLEALRGGDLDQ